MTARDDRTKPGISDPRKQTDRSLSRALQDGTKLSPEEIQKLVHELQVHQTELEMQNDELRRTQWDLEDSRSKYADLFDLAPVGYFTMDVQGRVIEANTTGLNLLGLERPKVIGQRFILFVKPEMINHFNEHCACLSSTKTKQTCDLKLKHISGSEFDARFESIAVEAAPGAPTYFRTAVTDISQFKRAEAELQASQERLRLAIQQSPMLLYHQDSSLRYTWVHEPYPGLTLEQIVGKHDEELFHLDEAVPITRLKQEVLETGRPARQVCRLTIGGKQYWYDLNVERMGSGATGISCAAVDVTSRQRQEDIIRRQNEEMEDFLYILAHDLKSPVVSLQGLLGILREEKESMLDADGCKILDYCTVECNRMTDIVAQVREMGRIKQTNVVPEEVNLNDFIEAVLQRFEGQIKDRGVTTKIECCDGDTVFPRAQVDQAVHNLIDNAMKYGLSGQNPELKITCEARADLTRITVEDNGPGISPAHHQQVFKLFRRLDPHGTIKGSGVGLTSVQSLMRRIGGEVSLNSDIGQGAKFTISFPSQMVTA